MYKPDGIGQQAEKDQKTVVRGRRCARKEKGAASGFVFDISQLAKNRNRIPRVRGEIGVGKYSFDTGRPISGTAEVRTTH